MNWLNIHTDILRSEKYLGAEPTERATWLSLLGWCATQENGGTIKNATEWKDRKWQQVCGITKDEVEITSELYEFQKGDLIVHYYPKDKEAEVSAKREAGKKGGRPKKTTTKAKVKPSAKASGNHMVKDTKSEAETEGNGRESKGKVKVSKPTTPDYVLPYDSIIFNQAWKEWLTYLKQKRKTPTIITIQKQLKQLKETNEQEAIKAINNSITNGWQGLFPANKMARTNGRASASKTKESGEGINVPLL